MTRLHLRLTIDSCKVLNIQVLNMKTLFLGWFQTSRGCNSADGLAHIFEAPQYIFLYAQNQLSEVHATHKSVYDLRQQPSTENRALYTWTP